MNRAQQYVATIKSGNIDIMQGEEMFVCNIRLSNKETRKILCKKRKEQKKEVQKVSNSLATISK